MIDDFARWLIKYDANLIRAWMLAILIVFWGTVGWAGYHALVNTGVMFP